MNLYISALAHSSYGAPAEQNIYHKTHITSQRGVSTSRARGSHWHFSSSKLKSSHPICLFYSINKFSRVLHDNQIDRLSSVLSLTLVFSGEFTTVFIFASWISTMWLIQHGVRTPSDTRPICVVTLSTTRNTSMLVHYHAVSRYPRRNRVHMRKKST